MARRLRLRRSRLRFSRRRRRRVRRRLNKRRFRRQLTQNALYYKTKYHFSVDGIPESTVRFGINFNGDETPNSTTATGTMAWFNVGSADAQSVNFNSFSDNVGDLYDQCRLAGVKIKWYPGLPLGSQTAEYLPCTVVYDRDGIEDDPMDSAFTNQLQQINQVRVKNMYRPWKVWIKAPKYRINSKIPSTKMVGTSMEPNVNLAGQWKRCSTYLNPTFGVDMSDALSRGTHLLVSMFLPRADTEEVLHFGSLVFTSYWVYKDRSAP